MWGTELMFSFSSITHDVNEQMSVCVFSPFLPQAAIFKNGILSLTPHQDYNSISLLQFLFK